MADKNKKCYMCDNYAVTDEHVPPACLFPKMKDSKGIDFRKNLITVPSCEIHNSKKSDDDEFLMFTLAGLIKNNFIGQLQHYSKATRAMRRKHKNFLTNQILRNHKYASIRTINNKRKIISIGNPNIERLNNCFEHIAYGLYFKEFNERFIGDIQILIEFVIYEDDFTQTLVNLIKKSFNVEEKLKNTIKGENKEVFTYEFLKPDENGLIALKLVFYGNAEVYIAFKKKGIKEPFDLATKLALGGIKTTYNIQGEKFTFN